MMDFELTCEVNGFYIPFIARITSVYKGYRGSYYEPPEPAQADFEILNMKGNPYPWLSDKMTSEQYFYFTLELIDKYCEDIEDQRAQDRLDRMRGK